MGVVGFLILTCGIGVIVWVMTTDIDDDVDLPDSEKRAIEPLGRYGLAGRGVAISLVGVYWMAAAIQGERSKAHELGGALQAVQQKSKGWLLLYDWYNGLTGDDGEIYHSEWRIDEDGHRWFNPHFPECEIRRIYFYTAND